MKNTDQTTRETSLPGQNDPLKDMDAIFDGLLREAQAAYQEAASRGYEELLNRISVLQDELSQGLRSTHETLLRQAQAEADAIVTEANRVADQSLPDPPRSVPSFVPGQSALLGRGPALSPAPFILRPEEAVSDEGLRSASEFEDFNGPGPLEAASPSERGDLSAVPPATTYPGGDVPLQPSLQPSPFSQVDSGEPLVQAGIAETSVTPLPLVSPQSPEKLPETGDSELVSVTAGTGERRVDREEVLRAVAAKTGFPREMLEEYLNSGMELELAPPKLIEIFKEISLREPAAPSLELSRMAELTDLASLVQFLTGVPTALPVAASREDAAGPAAATGQAPIEPVGLEAPTIRPLTPFSGGVTDSANRKLPVPPVERGFAAAARSTTDPIAPFSTIEEPTPATPLVTPTGPAFTLAPPAAPPVPPATALDPPASSGAPPAFTLAPPASPLTQPASPSATPAFTLARPPSVSANPAFTLAQPASTPTRPASASAPETPLSPQPRASAVAAARAAPSEPAVVPHAFTLSTSTASAETAAPSAPESLPVPGKNAGVIERLAMRAHVANASGLGLALLHGVGKIHIVPDHDHRIAEALRDLLHSEGYESEITSELAEDARGVIVLSGLSPAGVGGEAGVALQLKAFRAARAVTHALGNQAGLFVTVHDSGGDFAMSPGSENECWTAGSSGLVRALAKEYPRLAVKTLDMEREGRTDEVLARRILKELTEGGPEVEVGLSADGTRLTRSLESTDLATGGVPLEPHAVVVVQGAGQGILTHTVLEMARRQPLRFVLLGSVIYQEASEDPLHAVTDPDDVQNALAELGHVTPELLPRQCKTVLAQREVRRLKEELQTLGSSVCYFAVDSADASALDSILTQVRNEWGSPAAIIHSCEGQSPNTPALSESEEDLVQALRSDLSGIENLLALTKNDPLQLVGMLSPAVDQLGRSGQAGYAVTNEILNRLASSEGHRRGAKCAVRSINWTLCDDGTLGRNYKQTFAQRGIPLLSQDETGRVIVDELSNPVRGDVQVVLGPRLAPGEDFGSHRPARFNTLAEMQVSKARAPQLEDHISGGTCSVPAVMIMEWFLRYARQVAGPGNFRCRDFRQTQGITIPDIERDRVPLTLVMDSLEDVQSGRPSSLRLFDSRGQLHYSAVIDSVDNEQMLGLEAAPELALERTAWTGNHVYGAGALFHGPAFQVIHRVEGVSQHGALGRLVPPEDADWSCAAQVFHPAMLDGISQLAFVWGLFTQDIEFQLTAIGEFVQSPRANYNQALRCVLEGVESSPTALRINAYLESDGGDAVATLRNVEYGPMTRQSNA